MSYMNGVPLLWQATENSYGTPVPTGALHGITLSTQCTTWDGASVLFYICPINSVDPADYTPLELSDGTQLSLTANAAILIPGLNPGVYVIAQLTNVGASTDPVNAYMG